MSENSRLCVFVCSNNLHVKKNKGAEVPKKFVILPDKGQSVNLDFFHLSETGCFLLKALQCITLSTCEAWQVVVYPGVRCFCHRNDSGVLCVHV